MDSVNSEQMDKACTHALTWFFSIVLLNAKYYCSIFICRNQHNDSWFLIKKKSHFISRRWRFGFLSRTDEFHDGGTGNRISFRTSDDSISIIQLFLTTKEKVSTNLFCVNVSQCSMFFYVHFISTVLIFHLINIFGIKRRICN